MVEQRFAFDAVAASYDKVRPSYPDSLFDDICAISGLSREDKVLELGCGTGKATRPLSLRSREITALDPGGQLLTVARQLLADRPNIQYVESTFEAWSAPARTYKLVASAQAFHWIEPGAAFSKSAEALVAGGWLAVFGNVPVGMSPSLVEGIKAAYRAHVPAYVGQALPESWYLPEGPIAGLFDQSKRFGPVTHRHHAWTWSHTTETYVAFVRSMSHTQVLPEAQREPLLAAIAKAVDMHGGRAEVNYQAHLYMAQRGP
jgi:SAM-dependent methyltransferase